MNLENRFKRLEQRLGLPKPPSATTIALAMALTSEELDLLEERALALDRGDTFEDTPEMQNVLRRVGEIVESVRTGKPYVENCPKWSKDQQQISPIIASERCKAT